MDEAMVKRAQGCLLGQLSGDALGSLVEFQTADEIAAEYPNGVREMMDGGTFDTIAGQPTDDSEMALLLARLLVERGRYDAAEALDRYRYWLSTGPFDCGMTIGGALRGRLYEGSQANGAMMRISPLGIFGASLPLPEVARMARADAALTHPNLVCGDANALFTMAIAEAVRDGPEPADLYRKLVAWAAEMEVAPSVRKCVADAAERPPDNPMSKQGWVLVAFQNALHRLLHARNFEEVVVESIALGGDTDTNAAIAGALLGAVRGRDAVPLRWVACLQQCRPERDRPGVRRPRPEVFWPCDVLELGERLALTGGWHRVKRMTFTL